MSFLRIAAVVVGLVAVPVLFASAETLASRVRDAERVVLRDEATRSSVTDATGSVPPPADQRRHADGAAPSGDHGEASWSERSAAPSFGRIVIDPSGASSFEGRSAPGAEVVLTLDARPLGEARADAAGVWRLSVAAPLAAGDHTISSAAKPADRRPALAGQDIRIAIPEALMPGAVVTYDAPPAPSPSSSSVPSAAAPTVPSAAAPTVPSAAAPTVPNAAAPRAADPLRSRAEELATAASRRFTEVTAAAEVPVAMPAAPRAVAQATPAEPQAAPAPLRSRRQSQAADPQPPSAGPGGAQFAAPVVEWLERSAREYQHTIVKGLSEPAAGRAAVPSPVEPGSPRKVIPSGAPSPASPARDGTVAGDLVTDAQIAVQEWLARANRSYQTEIMRKLEQPAAGTGIAASPPVPRAKPDDKAAAAVRDRQIAAETKAAQSAEAEAPKQRADEAQRLADERRRAEADKRAADTAQPAPPKPIEQVVPVTPPKIATPVPSDDDIRRKRAADEAATAQTKAAEAKRRTDEAKRQSDELAKKQSDEARKAADAAAAKRREDEARRADETRRAADKKSADAARKVSERTRAAETPAPKGETPSAPTAADLARKAVDAARSGPAQRAAEQKPAAEAPGKGPSASGPSGASSSTGRTAVRKKDDRIAEGSGETGPVDLPKPQAGDRTGRTAAVSGPRGRTCGRAGRDIRPPGTYVIGSGDTLSEIAERHYGSARRMGRIVKANRRKLRDPDVIRICQQIWLP